MDNNLAILLAFSAILVMLVSGALGMWVTGEKGKNTLFGFAIGALLPLVGVIGLMMFVRTSDKVIVEEMYDRKMMDIREFEETMEFKIKK